MFCVDSLDSFYIPLTTGPYGMKGSYLAQKVGPRVCASLVLWVKAYCDHAVKGSQSTGGRMILVMGAMQSQRDNCWSAAASEAKAADWAGQEQDLESLDTQAQTRILAFRPSSGEPQDL